LRFPRLFGDVIEGEGKPLDPAIGKGDDA